MTTLIETQRKLIVKEVNKSKTITTISGVILDTSNQAIPNTELGVLSL